MQTQNWTMKALAALSVTLLPLSLSCDPIECGDGTTEVDGECTPAEAQVPEESCGPGTVLMDGRCVSLTSPTSCGENTTEIEDPDNPGSFICVGVGNCQADLVCPAPTVPGSITVCGRIVDIGTGAPTQRSTDVDTTPCGPEDDGTPCEFGVQLVQANTTGGFDVAGATPASFLDACGRFRFENVPTGTVYVPFGAVIVSNSVSGNERLGTATALALPDQGAADAGNVAFSLSAATLVGDWVPDDATLGSIQTDGAVMLRYLNPSPLGPATAPAAGTFVLQYAEDSPADMPMPVPYRAVPDGPGQGKLYYFTDSNPAEAKELVEETQDVTMMPPSVTGANGWALITGGPTTPVPVPGLTTCGAGDDAQCVWKFFGSGSENATCNGNPNGGQGVWFPVPLPISRVNMPVPLVLVVPMPLIDAVASAGGDLVLCDE